MAVKAKLDTLEGLPPGLAKEYEEIEIEKDGKKAKQYRLTVEGAFLHDEDIGPALRARDHEKKARQEVETKLKDAMQQAQKLQEDLDAVWKGAVPKADVERLEKSYKERHEKTVAELTADRDAAFGTVKKLLVDNTAVSLATKISDAPDLMLPIVQKRLSAEKTSDGYVLRVLDSDGKPSAMTVEELEKEIRADKRYAKIVIGSKASGGGAGGGSGGGGGNRDPKDPFAGKDWSKVDPNKLKPSEIVAYQKWKKAQTAPGA